MTWQSNYEMWKNFSDLDTNLAKELEELQGDEEALADAFYQPLAFGTAGMRGVIGAGINRMNRYTVRQASEGLAELIMSYGQDAIDRGVVIAYDSRHYSPEFALEAALTLANHGIKAYVFESLRPTPELSFAVRELGTFAGIMITASHNPPEYNGYKVYGQDGGQMPPKDADALTQYVQAVANPLTVSVADQDQALAQGLLEFIGEAIDKKYLAAMESVTIDPDLIQSVGNEVKIVYTPLHGTGQMLVESALEQAGFTETIYVAEQKEPDADFSTVKSPNPEEAEAFNVAETYGEKYQADILIATDPDADRMGASVRLPDGSYQVITGNQIAALMTYYILKTKADKDNLPEHGVILKSIVSSELPAVIAASFDIETIDVLTGFKFIAEQIKRFEADHSHEFLFGFEESYGYLVEAFVRDKDAVQATLLLAELAAYYKAQGKTVYDGLIELFETYGYYKEATIAVKKPGQAGAQEIQQLMADLREQPLTEIAGVPVEKREDYQTLQRHFANGDQEDMTFAQANVLKYYLTDKTWIAIRPSGTEPKIKFYIGANDSSQEAVDKKLAAFQAAIEELSQ
ncbi:phospho-sugar mutase [Aerococcus kribbianus]|uniref:Phosphoglucomutase n=1 Tax=Aerococcus kribbianus TaxID=2999064 RepID=A0A9X3FSA8_9LACT|nr:MULTISPECIES: phospho-sugar mutase [unclassified Aerococcus]MCZ0717482.1 phospho-sugar mutase [Aerococcus sp. YH-aer221]MCZ0725770.1 phospho-sugar mutase [Aerococcus sp. YH-aer222]